MPESHFLRSEVFKLVSRSSAGDQAPPARRLFTPPRGRWLLLISILSAAYTANVIQWSLRFGRLAMDPVFDDVGYLTDGLQRLNILDQAGFHAFCRSFVQAPPHSPWSTLLATSAFSVFGVHDWAPYLLNGLLVFIFLCLAWDIVDHKIGGSVLSSELARSCRVPGSKYGKRKRGSDLEGSGWILGFVGTEASRVFAQRYPRPVQRITGDLAGYQHCHRSASEKLPSGPLFFKRNFADRDFCSYNCCRRDGRSPFLVPVDDIICSSLALRSRGDHEIWKGLMAGGPVLLHGTFHFLQAGSGEEYLACNE